MSYIPKSSSFVFSFFFFPFGKKSVDSHAHALSVRVKIFSRGLSSFITRSVIIKRRLKVRRNLLATITRQIDNRESIQLEEVMHDWLIRTDDCCGYKIREQHTGFWLLMCLMSEGNGSTRSSNKYETARGVRRGEKHRKKEEEENKGWTAAAAPSVELWRQIDPKHITTPALDHHHPSTFRFRSDHQPKTFSYSFFLQEKSLFFAERPPMYIKTAILFFFL